MSKQTTIAEMLYGVATVGERGQMVIPIEARRHCGIEPNDKVLVFAHPQTNGFVVCKPDALGHIVREMKKVIRSASGGNRTRRRK